MSVINRTIWNLSCVLLLCINFCWCHSVVESNHCAVLLVNNRSGARTWTGGRRVCRACWRLVKKWWTALSLTMSTRWPRNSRNSRTGGRKRATAPSNARYLHVFTQRVVLLTCQGDVSHSERTLESFWLCCFLCVVRI